MLLATRWGGGVVISIAALINVACPTSPSSGRAVITGRIELADVAGLNDQSRVRVDLGRGEGGVSVNEDGTFELSDLEPDVYSLAVVYVGGLTSQASRSAYRRFQVRVTARAGSESGLGTIRLERATGTVSGAITGGATDDLSNAGLTLELDSGQRLSAATGPGGVFLFPAVPVGIHALSAFKDGFATGAAQGACRPEVRVTEEDEDVRVTDLVLAQTSATLSPGFGEVVAEIGSQWFTRGRTSVTVNVSATYAKAAHAWRNGRAPAPYSPFSGALLLDGLTPGHNPFQIQLTNGCGYESALYSIDVVVDDDPPVITAARLEDGNAYATQLPIRLTVEAQELLSPPLKMRYALCEVAGAQWTCGSLDTAPWTDFLPEMLIPFPSQDGQRGVQLQVRDLAGNESLVAQDEILVDSQPPQLASVVVGDGSGVVRALQTVLQINAVGAAYMKTGTVSGLAGSPWQVFSATSFLSFSGSDGPKTVYVSLKDEAGNLTAENATLVTLSTTGALTGTALLEGLGDPSVCLVQLVGTSFQTNASSMGAWTLTAVPAGAYLLRVLVTGPTANQYLAEEKLVNVAVGETSTVEPMTVRRARGSAAGIVTLEGQTEHTGTVVEVVGTTLTTVTTPAGAWSLQDAPVGTFNIRYSHPGFSADTVTGISIGVGLLANVPTRQLALQRGTISGMVVLEGATDHSGATVDLIGTTFSATSDALGAWHIDNVPVGFYSVRATKLPDFIENRQNAVYVNGTAASDAGTFRLDRERGRIRGLVIASGLTDHSATRVELLGTNYATDTVVDGSFDFFVPVGNYNGVRITRAHYASRDVIATITVAKEGTASVPAIQLVGVDNDVSGRVTRFNQMVNTGLRVELTGVSGQPTDGLRYTLLTTDPQGRFMFTGVLLGPYTVHYSYPDGASWETITRTVDLAAGPALTLAPEVLREMFLQINGDADATRLLSVTLTLGASDCVQMCVANTPCPGTGPWVTCQQTVTSWPLAGPDGLNTVYVRFKDSLGIVSNAVSDTILLDRSAIISSVTQNTGGAPRGRNSVIHFTLNASAETGGVATVDIAGYQTGITLYDDGTHGDAVATNGTYESDFSIVDSRDVVNAVVTGRFTDGLGSVAAPVNASGAVTIAIPPVISAIAVTPNSANGTASIAWTTDESATGRLEWGTTSFYGNTVNQVTATTQSVSVSGLLPSTEYHFRITATDIAGNVSITTDRVFWVKPNAPSSVIAIPGAGRFDVRWEAPPQTNIAGYNVYRATVSGGPYTKMNLSGPYNHPALLYSDLTVSNTQTYYYKVSAVDDTVLANESDHSVEVSGIPTENSGAINVAGAISGTEVWSSSRGPYRVVGNILVQAGSRLIVGPGADVQFMGNFYVQVEGQLVVVGTSANPGRFRSGAATPSSGYWIQIAPTAVASVTTSDNQYARGTLISGAQIEHSQSGVRAHVATYIGQSTFFSSGVTGIDLRMRGNIFDSTDIATSDIISNDCTFQNGTVAYSGSGSAVFMGSIFENSSTVVARQSHLKIIGCQFIDNGSYAINYVNGASPLVVVNSTFQGGGSLINTTDRIYAPGPAVVVGCDMAAAYQNLNTGTGTFIDLRGPEGWNSYGNSIIYGNKFEQGGGVSPGLRLANSDVAWNHFSANNIASGIVDTVGGSFVGNSFIGVNSGPLVTNITPRGRDVTAGRVYWGGVATADMDLNGADANIGLIRDFYDDITYSKVVYAGWLHDAAPLLRVTLPAWDTSFKFGAPVTFVGTAQDHDGSNYVPLNASRLTWTSQTDGLLGTGSPLTVASLSVGTHRIWVSALDDSGNEGRTLTEVVVTP